MTRRLPLITALAIACLAIGAPNDRLVAQDQQDLADPSPSQAVQARSAQRTNKLYIVRMADLPVVSSTGGVQGLAATKPARGQKIDPNSPTVSGYAAYLDGQHTRAAGAVGGRKVYDYRYSINAFAAELSDAQAAALANVA